MQAKSGERCAIQLGRQSQNEAPRAGSVPASDGVRYTKLALIGKTEGETPPDPHKLYKAGFQWSRAHVGCEATKTAPLGVRSQ